MNMPHAKQLYFEDFTPGRVFEGQRRTLDEQAFLGFARLTGDAHPIHYDAEYASRTRFGKPVAHGLLVAAVGALGATPVSRQMEESLVAFLEQDAKFLKPVLLGDEVRTEFEVESATPTRSGATGVVRFTLRVYAATGELAMVGHHSYLLKTRSGAAA
jgi:acyl dehydratase